jgi:hypothetical protein
MWLWRTVHGPSAPGDRICLVGHREGPVADVQDYPAAGAVAVDVGVDVLPGELAGACADGEQAE